MRSPHPPGRPGSQRQAHPGDGRDGRAGWEPGPAASGEDLRAVAEGLIWEAVAAAHDADELAWSVSLLAGLPGHPSSGGTWPGLVLSGCLVDAVRGAWSRGWQPLDVPRAVARRLTARHATLAVDAIAEEARTSAVRGGSVPGAWAAQLRDIGVTIRSENGRRNFVEYWSDCQRLPLTAGLLVGIQLLATLVRLPALPLLMPPPSEWDRSGPRPSEGPPRGGADGRILTKVRALLAKAESTTFEAEADALTAKAQELMARHAIDHAMVHGTEPGEAPGGRRVAIDDPYRRAKASLLNQVAGANRCRTVWYEPFGFASVVGFPVDLDSVEVLYTSLLIQATRAMVAAGSRTDRSGRSRTRSFRLSFLVAFAGRIGERLAEATASATAEAGARHGDALLPVLAGRRAEVDDAFEATFPHVVTTNLSVTNREGWVAGRVAADLAHLGPDQALPPGGAG
jgi:hypothetical protein